MTFLRYLLLALIILGTPVWSAAHGTGQHVLGVINAIDETHIQVKTPKGNLVSVRLSAKTQYISKNLKRPKSPPQIGDRVVIEAEKEDKELVATEIHYSDSKPAEAKPKAAH